MRSLDRLLLIARTVRYLKPIQVWNRLFRRFLPNGGNGADRTADLPSFTFLNLTAKPRGWNDPSLPKLWLYNLHYFENREMMALAEQWIVENPRGVGNGWEPYPISLRVVNWLKHLGPRVPPHIARSVREQVAYLLPRLEYHLLANHLLANAKALVFAGTRLKVDRWRKKGMAIYRRELPEQILDDGVHFERSAMYHAIILEDLLDLVELTDEALFRSYAEKMLAGLELLTGPDGDIAKFNDAADGVAKRPAALLARASRLGLSGPQPLNTSTSQPLRTSGYRRFECGAYCVIAKTGEIGPTYQPGHAHADTWTFEMWRNGTKVVTDTGTDRYVIDAERRRQRGTAAHNTVMIDGRDSSEVWAGHRVGRRFDFSTHRRTFSLTETGLEGVDELFGSGRHHVELRWHLMSGAEVEIACEGHELREEPCAICLEFGRQETGRVVSAVFDAEFPVRVKWQVK